MSLILIIKQFELHIPEDIVDTRQFILYFLDKLYIVVGIDMQACPLVVIKNGPKILKQCQKKQRYCIASSTRENKISKHM